MVQAVRTVFDKPVTCIRTQCGALATGYVDYKTGLFVVGTPLEFCKQHGNEVSEQFHAMRREGKV